MVGLTTMTSASVTIRYIPGRDETMAVRWMRASQDRLRQRAPACSAGSRTLPGRAPPLRLPFPDASSSATDTSPPAAAPAARRHLPTGAVPVCRRPSRCRRRCRWLLSQWAVGGSYPGAFAGCLRERLRCWVAGVGVGEARLLILCDVAEMVGGGSGREGKHRRCGVAKTVRGCSEGLGRQRGWGEAAGMGEVEAVWESIG